MSDSMSLFPNDAGGQNSEQAALRPSSAVPTGTGARSRKSAESHTAGFGIRVRDAATNTYAEDIIDVVTGPLGLTVIHARIPVEHTLPLQIPTGTPNDDIIFASDVAERNGGVISIDVTDETAFFIGPYSNPIRLYGEDGVAAAREILARQSSTVSPPTIP